MDRWPDGTVVSAENGELRFICTYRNGVRRAVPANYSGGKTILLRTEANPEFSTAHPECTVEWTPDELAS